MTDPTPRQNWIRCASFADVKPDGHNVIYLATLYGSGYDDPGACRYCCIDHARRVVAEQLREGSDVRRGTLTDHPLPQNPDRWP